MRNVALLLVLVFLQITLSNAQTEKPVTASASASKSATPLPTQNSNPKTQNSTRAVVVGISDYQSSAIPDLHFAHRDAEAFAEWLKSPAGGNVLAENIRLLVNEQAKNAQIGAELDGLAEDVQPGDLAIIYFSGHGDVETKTRNQFGFLLAWDSPATNYKAGAYPLIFLQDIVATISDKGGRVLVIADACHAGKLAGSGIGGTQATAESLKAQFANEVKIMSCQPNELALEGEQWGGGRGLFSWHLIEGLTGLADRNQDATINLHEMDRYLGDVVPEQAAPHSQYPVVMGDRQAVLARVDAAALTALQAQKTGQPKSITPTGGKGLADGLLAEADSTAMAWYRRFEHALKSGDLLGGPECADALFRQLSQVEALRPIHNLMRRNLAAALQNEPQQALNSLLDNDPYAANVWNFNPQHYAAYPSYLQRSMELLGEDHYMYRPLLAKKLYFEGVNLAKNFGALDNDPARRDSFKIAAKAKFLESIRIEPEAAYPYHAIGNLYLNNAPVSQPDSVLLWDSLAIERTPGWLGPYMDIFSETGPFQANVGLAEYWLQKALLIHPNSYMVLERLSWLKQWQGKADESIAICKQLIALKPDIFNAWSTMSSTLTYMKGEYFESDRYCLKSIELEPNQWWWAQYNMALNCLKTRRFEKAVELGKQCLQHPQATEYDKGMLLGILTAALVEQARYDEATYYFHLADSLQLGGIYALATIGINKGRILFRLGQWNKAEEALEAAFAIDPTDNARWVSVWALLGEIKARQDKPAEAEALFRKAVGYRGALFEENYFRDEAFFRYGYFLLTQKRPAEAEAQFREIAKILPKSYYHGYGMALLDATRGKHTEALEWLEKSLENFWPDKAMLLEEPLFQKIHKTKRFKALLAKHFPETSKQ